MLNLIGFLSQFIAFVSISAIVISCISSPQSPVVGEVTVANATLPNASDCLSYDELADLEFEQAQSSIPCGMVKAATITTIISEFEPYPADIDSMTVKQLKAYAKASGFTGYSALRKHELLALLSEF